MNPDMTPNRMSLDVTVSPREKKRKKLYIKKYNFNYDKLNLTWTIL